LLKTYCPLLTSSAAELTDLENIQKKSRKIRIYPDLKQKKLLRKWFGVSRYVYNKTIEYLKQPDTRANWKEIKTDIIHSLPEWSEEVPYQIKSIAIKDACVAVRNAKVKYKETGIFNDIKFKSRKKRKDSLYIPKSAVKGQKVYPTVLGELKTFKEKIPFTEFDARLKFEYGRYYLCVVIKANKKVSDNQRNDFIALDPGVRTFQTFYSQEIAGKIGNDDMKRIYRLCDNLDKNISKMSKVNSKERRILRRKNDKLRFKIHNLVEEVHHKTALFLVKNYKYILLPSFETSQMVTKLYSKVARSMLTWSHFKFKQFLKCKAREYDAVVIEINESYTSKTCGKCGYILNDLGGKKVFKCPVCGLEIDRDYNGVRNVYLRTLVDTPAIVN
jgi:putative transposase